LKAKEDDVRIDFFSMIDLIIELIQIQTWINSEKEEIVNYKWDFSFSLENFAWANSIKEGIVGCNSLNDRKVCKSTISSNEICSCNSTPSLTFFE
jgi:hypothetical protein